MPQIIQIISVFLNIKQMFFNLHNESYCSLSKITVNLAIISLLQYENVKRLLTASDLLPQVTRTTPNCGACQDKNNYYEKKREANNRAAACDWCVRDSAKNCEVLKTKDTGDINNVLCYVTAILNSMSCNNRKSSSSQWKNTAHLHSPQFGICHHSESSIVLKVKVNIINKA